MADDPYVWRITLILEGGKCIRWITVTAGLVTTFWIAADAFVEYSSIPRQWWEYILNPVTPGAMGALPTWWLVKRLRRYIRRVATRNSAVEKKADPGRTTSGLNIDGTHDND